MSEPPDNLPITQYDDYRDLVRELARQIEQLRAEVSELRDERELVEHKRRELALAAMELRDFATQAERLAVRLQKLIV